MKINYITKSIFLFFKESIKIVAIIFGSNETKYEQIKLMIGQPKKSTSKIQDIIQDPNTKSYEINNAKNIKISSNPNKNSGYAIQFENPEVKFAFNENLSRFLPLDNSINTIIGQYFSYNDSKFIDIKLSDLYQQSINLENTTENNHYTISKIKIIPFLTRVQERIMIVLGLKNNQDKYQNIFLFLEYRQKKIFILHNSLLRNSIFSPFFHLDNISQSNKIDNSEITDFDCIISNNDIGIQLPNVLYIGITKNNQIKALSKIITQAENNISIDCPSSTTKCLELIDNIENQLPGFNSLLGISFDNIPGSSSISYINNNSELVIRNFFNSRANKFLSDNSTIHKQTIDKNQEIAIDIHSIYLVKKINNEYLFYKYNNKTFINNFNLDLQTDPNNPTINTSKTTNSPPTSTTKTTNIHHTTSRITTTISNTPDTISTHKKTTTSSKTESSTITTIPQKNTTLNTSKPPTTEFINNESNQPTNFFITTQAPSFTTNLLTNKAQNSNSLSHTAIILSILSFGVLIFVILIYLFNKFRNKHLKYKDRAKFDSASSIVSDGRTVYFKETPNQLGEQSDDSIAEENTNPRLQSTVNSQAHLISNTNTTNQNKKSCLTRFFNIFTKRKKDLTQIIPMNSIPNADILSNTSEITIYNKNELRTRKVITPKEIECFEKYNNILNISNQIIHSILKNNNNEIHRLTYLFGEQFISQYYVNKNIDIYEKNSLKFYEDLKKHVTKQCPQEYIGIARNFLCDVKKQIYIYCIFANVFAYNFDEDLKQQNFLSELHNEESIINAALIKTSYNFIYKLMYEFFENKYLNEKYENNSLALYEDFELYVKNSLKQLVNREDDVFNIDQEENENQESSIEKEKYRPEEIKEYNKEVTIQISKIIKEKMPQLKELLKTQQSSFYELIIGGIHSLKPDSNQTSIDI